MAAAVLRTIEQHHESDAPGAGYLGRHIHLDPQSEAYRVKEKITGPLLDPAQLPSKIWPRHIKPFDQSALGPQKTLSLGCCTVVGGLGTVRTTPINQTLTSAQKRVMTDPVPWYSKETAADEFPGQYPPDDTGSSVLAFMKLAQANRWISSYNWSMSHTELANGLQTGPAEVGTYWTEGMDRPDDHGVVHPTGQDRGGHAYECAGRHWDVDSWFYVFIQSWGLTWPQKPALGMTAHFAVPEPEFLALLDREGEVAFPQPVQLG